MAAMQSMLNSMTPRAAGPAAGPGRAAARRHGPALAGGPARPAPAVVFPQMGWDQRYDFEGQDPLNFGEAMDLMQQLGDMDQLENLLRGATNPARWRRPTSTGSAIWWATTPPASLERLAELAKMLEEAGLIENKEGRLELTPKGIRRMGSNALDDLFRKLTKDKMGQHQIDRLGIGHERAYETKPYEFGDPFNLDIHTTIRNAIRRPGGGTPVRLHPTTSRSSGPRTSPGPRPSSCSTCRCRCRCATTSCPPRRWRWRCTR